MEALLVIIRLEELASQLIDLPIVPPEEAYDDQIKKPRHGSLRPNGSPESIKRGDRRQPALPLVRIVFDPRGVGDINRYKNTSADDSQNQEHVAEHTNEAKEDGGVHADLRNEVFLLRLPHHEEP